MNARTRFVLGGIGGLAPILIFLINVDFERYVLEASILKTVGFVVRAILLFLLGGFVAYLHETEKKRITLFLLGVSAPSLIAGFLTTANLSQSQLKSAETTKQQTHLLLVPSAFAQAPATELSEGVKRFTLPRQSGASEFVEGLLGIQPKNVWFVIVGSHLNVDDAKKQAASINQRFKGYKAEVYAPYGDNPYYAVVIGAHLTQAQAKALRDRAVRDGFPRDIYYKTFPNLPPAQTSNS